ALTLRPGMVVSGRVVFEGTTLKPPADLSAYRFSLGITSPSRVTLGVQPVQVEANGTFQMSGVPPGQFAPRLITPATPGQPPGTGWMLKAVLLDGRDLLDFPLDV